MFEDSRWQKLARFVDLLVLWNRRLNLVSRADTARIVSRHVLESIGLLLVAAPLQNSTVMDVGSGGGFPGVPMKILRPDLELTLAESSGKKARFLMTVGEELALERYSVRQCRVETIAGTEVAPQALVTARAVAELSKLWTWTNKLLAPAGRLCAIKGGAVSSELASLSDQDDRLKVSVERFPEWLGIESCRFVVIVHKQS